MHEAVSESLYDYSKQFKTTSSSTERCFVWVNRWHSRIWLWRCMVDFWTFVVCAASSLWQLVLVGTHNCILLILDEKARLQCQRWKYTNNVQSAVACLLGVCSIRHEPTWRRHWLLSGCSNLVVLVLNREHERRSTQCYPVTQPAGFLVLMSSSRVSLCDYTVR